MDHNNVRQPSSRLIWIFVFAGINILTLLITLQFYIRYERFYKQKLSFLETLAYTIPDWYTWMLLGPLVYWFANKFPIHKETWKIRFPFHIVFCILITVSQFFASMLCVQIVDYFKGQDYEFWRPFEYNLLSNFHWSFILYWAIVAVSYSVNYYKKYHDTEIKSAQLSEQLSRAKLQALRMQLQPHFLFNTLNTISYYTYIDPKVSDRMVQLLSGLLRMVLDQDQHDKVPLRKEIEFLQQYLEIETFRFQDKLTVEWNVDENVLDALVPSLILQPAVENAMRHGISKLPSSARLMIDAHQQDEKLIMTVTDNGPGIPQLENNTFREGIGLSNIRLRLAQMYGDRHDMKIMNPKPSGVAVQIKIPYEIEAGKV